MIEEKPHSAAQSGTLRGTYDHKTVEAHWQKVWQQSKLDQTDISWAKKPFYNLMMFPYPSAEGLHVGNMYAFTGSDIYGRFKRMNGYNVFEPIGLDGFGIHSENYALKVGRHPMDHAKITEKHFYDQLHKIGAMFDWSRTVETYDPDYYRWTQWIFVQMFKHELAYRGSANVNWCPKDKTVLADEQVIDGKCERCGNIVEKRLLKQWFFRITAYAEKLLENLSKLDWSEKVKVAQHNWIGKKEGIVIKYQISPAEPGQANIKYQIECFTTRPYTMFGATFVALAPEHPLVTKLSKQGSGVPEKIRSEMTAYIKNHAGESEADRIAEGRKKTGVFTGFYCVNHLNKYKMPLYISDFVVMGVGTGAVVGVPGHDQRDFEFAKTFDLPIKQVVIPTKNPDLRSRLVDHADSRNGWTDTLMGTIAKKASVVKRDNLGVDSPGFEPGRLGVSAQPSEPAEPTQISVYSGEGILVNSGKYSGMSTEEGRRAIGQYLTSKGFGEKTVAYHLRDWLISRQRYWGPPIPMIFCEKCADEGKSWFTTEEAPTQKLASRSLKLDEEVGNEKLENRTSNFRSHYPTSDFQQLTSPMAGWYPIPEDQLPVVLPRIEDYKPGDDGIAPLAKHKEFYETVCPGCRQKAVRETDVMDTFVDSSWYFLRYPSIHLTIEDRTLKAGGEGRRSRIDQEYPSSTIHPQRLSSTLDHPLSSFLPWDPAITKKWLPVDMYTGGAEHSVLHLLYSRFVTMAFHDWGLISQFDEPFIRFYAHGLVIKDGAKMSKSKGNVINPDEYIATYGADSLRLYLMFMGPFDQGGDFRDTAMEGMHRWVNRVWRIAMRSIAESDQFNQSDQLKIKKALHRLTKKVTEDIEKRRYNTAIASMMEFTNLVADNGGVLSREDLLTFLKLFAPFAPFVTEELWQRMQKLAGGSLKLDAEVGNLNLEDQTSHFQPQNPTSNFQSPTSSFYSIHLQPWPIYNPAEMSEEFVQILIQINGKLRDKLEVSNQQSKDQSDIEKLALSRPKVQKFLGSTNAKNIIFVPGRLINIVI